MVRMGFSYVWISLATLALLGTRTVVSGQGCQQLMLTCHTLSASPSLYALATGLESRIASCSQPVHEIMSGDMLQWYFTRNTIANASIVNTSNTGKYVMTGVSLGSQLLTVNNITFDDEGYYFCQVVRSGVLLSNTIQGTCLYAFRPAQFETCSAGNSTLQVGCSGVEVLSSSVGQLAKFNIALTNQGATDNCFDQLIHMITLLKNGSPIVECSNISCQSLDPRVNVIRPVGTFNITITLHNLNVNDGGSYVAIADTRMPSNNMRFCIYKNFSLNIVGRIPDYNQCQNLMNLCAAAVGAKAPPLRALATGKEDVQIMCSPEASFTDLGDTFQWYFTRTTIDEGIQLRGNSKYAMSGSASQILTIRNISLSDEGLYYCKTARNGMLVSEIMPGACVFTYGPVLFETCEGDENMNTPQVGCSRTEKLSSRVGQSVEFHIALSQQGTIDNCFNQTIQVLSLSKNINGSETVLVECSNISCNFDNPRLKVTRSVGRFSIVVSLHDLDKSDSGSYSATAQIRRPSNNMRVHIFKHFSLDVADPTGPQSLGVEEIYILSGVLSMAVLLTLILVLCVCIICILRYHCKNKENRLGQILRGNSHREPLYDNPDDPRYVLSPVSAPLNGTRQ